MTLVASKKSSTARIAMILALLTIVTLFFVWTRLQNIRLKRELARLKQQEQRLSLENARLQLDWAQTISPNRLELIGWEKFNLKRPLPNQVVVLTEPK